MLPHPGWLPSPEEIRAECLRIRAEKGNLPEQRVQRLDLRTLIEVDASEDDDDDDLTTHT